GVQPLQSVPQVEAVALTSRLPLSLNNNGFSVYVAGSQSATNRPVQIDGASIDERYFSALGIKLLAGRGVEPADRTESRRVAVITNTMAQRFWPGGPEAALGREFRFREDGDPIRVIGVVSDYKVDTPGERPKPYLHLP